MQKILKLCIFDLDDTLISTEPIYEKSRHDFAHKVRKYCKQIAYDAAYNTVQEVGWETKTSEGFSAGSHPLSFYRAYERLCKKHDLPFLPEHGEDFADVARKVYSTYAPAYEYTHRILKSIQSEGYEMIVCTRGDKTVQLRRVLDAQLANYFDNIFVADRKTPEYFHKICAFYGVYPNQAVMIGNHMVGDVLPALEAGLFGIFVPNGTSDIEKVLQPPPSEEQFENQLYRGKDLRSVYTLIERINIKHG